jgi:glycosyltransferase involved in cell wall biosynthesis
MKILITTPSFYPEKSGVANAVYNHALELTRRGHAILVATGASSAQKDSGLPFAVERFRVSGSAHFRNRYAGEIGRYREFVGSSDADAIVCHCWQAWNTDLACQAFPKQCHAKVLMSHGVSANHRGGTLHDRLRYLSWRPYVKVQMPRILRQFDGLVTLSGTTRKDVFYDNVLKSKMNFKSFTVIPNGVRMEEAGAADDSFRTRMGLGNAQIVLCVGNYTPKKNQRDALRAFVHAQPANAILVFIGSESTPDAERLSAESARLASKRPHARILVLDGLSRSEIFNAYKAADVVLCPSLLECFPLVTLDAMASGRPYISYDVGSVSDLPGGIVAADWKGMGDALGSLLENSEARKRLGEAGRSACAELYNWPRIGALIEQFCSRLLSNEPRMRKHGAADLVPA